MTSRVPSSAVSVQQAPHFQRGFSEQSQMFSHSHGDIRAGMGMGMGRMHSAPTSPVGSRRVAAHGSVGLQPQPHLQPHLPLGRARPTHQSAPTSPILAPRQMNVQPQTQIQSPASRIAPEKLGHKFGLQSSPDTELQFSKQTSSSRRTDVLREIERRHKLGELPYYHGRMSCAGAKELLMHREVSMRTFLMHVQEDASQRLSFFLSVKGPAGVVSHVPVVLDQYGVFLEKGQFNSVPQLILHLRKTPLSIGGLSLGALKGFLPCA